MIGSARAQQTVGLFEYDPKLAYSGLTLFAPSSSTITYLIDNCGRVVHSWQSQYKTGHSVYLLEDGSILRAGQMDSIILKGAGAGGIVERIGWDGSLLWSYTVNDSSLCQHHDIRPMPNGNVLILAWERKSIEEVKAAGRKTVMNEMWCEKILEVKPTGATSGEVVWEWSLWNHLVQETDSTKANYGKVSEHPERMNINYGNLVLHDWVHANSVAYNPELDQIMISAHTPHEIWVIDHSTTKAEAATSSGGRSGKGGDFLFRWGNSAIYNLGTTGTDRFPGGQHDAQWIPKGYPDEGKIMVFNNRAGGTGASVYSSVDIIAPVRDESGNYVRTGTTFVPDSIEWRYVANPPTAFYGVNISGAQRLPNGNTLICNGPRGTLFEINPAKEIVWRYINPVAQKGIVKQGDTITNNPVFRCLRYSYDYPAFKGRNLTGGDPIELEPLVSTCALPTSVNEEAEIVQDVLRLSPNPALGLSVLSFSLATPQSVSLEVFDVLGKKVSTLIKGDLSAGEHSYTLSSEGKAALLFVRLISASGVQTVPLRFSGE